MTRQAGFDCTRLLAAVVAWSVFVCASLHAGEDSRGGSAGGLRASLRVDALVEPGGPLCGEPAGSPPPVRVRLDGRASLAAPGATPIYTWSLLEGSSAAGLLAEGSSARPEPTADGPLVVLVPAELGRYAVELTLREGPQRTSKARMVLRIDARLPDLAAPPQDPAKAPPARTGVWLGQRVVVSASEQLPVAAGGDHVQLFFGERPLASQAAPLTSEGTARLTGVTFSTTTTNGTVVTLERVRADGVFFFPHEVLRTYNLRISDTAAVNIVLGDPGTVFINRSILGTPVDITVNLGNRVPSPITGTGTRGCALGLDGARDSRVDAGPMALVLCVRASRRNKKPACAG